ncbi:hypothetical protein AAEU42_10200 [Pseudoflavonifractor phocaeensis]|uniref:hypothetical protein n=1 Tax=Pseudoflavonifractor phocaeensis TaxID=1870988 RepID=UPI00313B0AE8
MFYIKTELSEGVTLRSEITDENVFTMCPGCGCEHQVNLADVVDADDGLDLYGTVVLCAECSAKRLAEREEE